MDVTLADGSPACVICLRRPKRWTGKRWQSYCTPCHSENMRRWRRGKTTITVTEEQKQMIRQLLAAQPEGRHHASPER